MGQGQTLDCGVMQHDQDCLCDVVVTQTTSISHDLRHGWHVTRVMQFADVAAPLVGNELLKFLETWIHVYDLARQPRVANSTSFKPQAEPWRLHAQRRFAEGAASAVVRAELSEQFGVTISRSNAAHIRRRAASRGAA